MKKRGSFFAGMVVMLLIFSLIGTAAAATATVSKNLTYKNIKIMLNGKELTPKDAKGNVVEPFVIDGTTYLPVRAVGEALGLTVGWDGTTNTVTLISSDYVEPTPTPDPPKATSYPAGIHKVGVDIPAGEYVVLTTGSSGYFGVCADANCNDILFNDNFSYNSIITIKDGEYLELTRCVAIPVMEFYATQTIPTNVPGVMLKVGVDIPAGEYKIIATNGSKGYYCIYSDSRHSNIVSNNNFENSAYVSVQDGQYLELTRCVIQ